MTRIMYLSILSFTTFPRGIVGLFTGGDLAAAMSSTASELNALASTTTIDVYKRNIKKDQMKRTT